MSTLTRNKYAAHQWHEITAGEVITQITHNYGQGTIVYTEALAGSTLGDPYTSATPIYVTSEVGDIVYFTDIELVDSIYFYPLYNAADLTIAKD